MAQKGWLRQFPIEEMIKRNWIQDFGDNIADQIISLLNFFGVATPELWESSRMQRRLAFRKAIHLKSDIGATSAWLWQGAIDGEKVQCKPFDKERLISFLDKIRELTTEQNPQIFIPKLTNICAECGVAVVFVKPFPKVAIYGASCWLSPDKALIQLSGRGKTADTLWFTIFHEIAHIVLHRKKELFIEIEDKSGKKVHEEMEADKYATEVLIPSLRLNDWLELNKKTKLNAAIISEFAKELKIAPGILVGRLQYLKRIKYSEFYGLKFRYVWSEDHDEERRDSVKI